MVTFFSNLQSSLSSKASLVVYLAFFLVPLRHFFVVCIRQLLVLRHFLSSRLFPLYSRIILLSIPFTFAKTTIYHRPVFYSSKAQSITPRNIKHCLCREVYFVSLF
ncbi:hypothetical protein K457DRAFT_411568 [Linnemannia elongata AG-77]|uniref:Uncharacterized protein n=1 Tax=Linnemannia elongata AG-77 TaxID=1314771 RepID=A0A197K344_9FUNG|nr:hypothetical protein K457DRAFT_411568 [Linnemannia elongata AG-77]